MRLYCIFYGCKTLYIVVFAVLERCHSTDSPESYMEWYR